jgi:hypothetical protein
MGRRLWVSMVREATFAPYPPPLPIRIQGLTVDFLLPGTSWPGPSVQWPHGSLFWIERQDRVVNISSSNHSSLLCPVLNVWLTSFSIFLNWNLFKWRRMKGKSKHLCSIHQLQVSLSRYFWILRVGFASIKVGIHLMYSKMICEGRKGKNAWCVH